MMNVERMSRGQLRCGCVPCGHSVPSTAASRPAAHDHAHSQVPHPSSFGPSLLRHAGLYTTCCVEQRGSARLRVATQGKRDANKPRASIERQVGNGFSQVVEEKEWGTSNYLKKV